MPRLTLRERFFNMVVQGADPNDCWGWEGRCAAFGYGRLGLGNGTDTDTAHRISWRLHFGPIPPGFNVLHRCDNPPCANPQHLFLGTQADNIHDSQAKGRFPGPPHLQGEAHGSHKLTAVQVQEIRTRPGTIVEMAQRYGVHKNSIINVLSGKTWKSLP